MIPHLNPGSSVSRLIHPPSLPQAMNLVSSTAPALGAGEGQWMGKHLVQNFQIMDCKFSVIDCANSIFFFLMDDSGSQTLACIRITWKS